MSLVRLPVSLKVPARIAAIFWAIKLLTTAFGESTSDYLVHNVNPYLAVVGGFVVFVLAMALQLRTDRYVPWVYWLAVAMVAVFGTMAADVAAHRVRRALYRLLVALRGSARRRLLDLVADRADALDPQHHHHPARALLLGRRPRHLRHGHRARRPRRLYPEPGLFLCRDRLRLPVRAAGPGLLPAAHQRDPRLLGRLRADAATRRLVRRLDRKDRNAGGLGWATGRSRPSSPP